MIWNVAHIFKLAESIFLFLFTVELPQRRPRLIPDSPRRLSGPGPVRRASTSRWPPLRTGLEWRELEAASMTSCWRHPHAPCSSHLPYLTAGLDTNEYFCRLFLLLLFLLFLILFLRMHIFANLDTVVLFRFELKIVQCVHFHALSSTVPIFIQRRDAA